MNLYTVNKLTHDQLKAPKINAEVSLWGFLMFFLGVFYGCFIGASEAELLINLKEA